MNARELLARTGPGQKIVLMRDAAGDALLWAESRGVWLWLLTPGCARALSEDDDVSAAVRSITDYWIRAPMPKEAAT